MIHLLLALSLSATAAAQDGTVQVTLSSGSGKILVDGQDSGQRAPGQVALAPGKHTIQVNGDCLTASQQVEVVAGQTHKLALELQPVGGFAEIRVSDPEATLMVDGTPVPAPAMLPLACGEHQVKASAPGMATLEQTLVVEMGGAYRLNLQLEPEAATAVVASEPDPVVPSEDPKTEPPEPVVDNKPPEPVVDNKPPREPVEGRGAKIAGAGLAAVGVGAIAAGGVVRVGALPTYQEYAGLDSNGDGTIRSPEDAARADALWNDQIAPARSRSMALFAVGGVCLAAGTGVMVFVDEEGRPVMGYSGTF